MKSLSLACRTNSFPQANTIFQFISVWSGSSQSYNELQTSGMLVLPSGRLLQMYKNSVKKNPGMNTEVFEMMCNEANRRKLSEIGCRGGIVFDEMAIQEDLQLKEDNGLMQLVGLANMGEQDDYMRTIKKGN